MLEIRAVVSGLVQGVCFRDYVAEAAIELSLVGYVQNQPDGTVLVIASGAPEALKNFVEYLHEGSVLSRVEGVDVEWQHAKKEYEDFSIRFTTLV